MSYLRYSPSVESPKPGEDEAIQGIVEHMGNQVRIVAEREHHAVRASHAKSTAVVRGRLEVRSDLVPELAQGLFARAGTYDVLVRFAQGPGETLPDKVSTHRGMSIKVFGVEGEKLGDHTDPTQDFVLASGPTFPSGTAEGFLRDERQIEAATPQGPGFKSAVSAVARGVNTVLKAVGTESAKADFFGHPFSHPLSEPYYSQAPLRYGDYVAKIAAFPASPAQGSLKDDTIDASEDDDAFRTAMTRFFQDEDARFELRAQLWTDAETQPIEDASVEWKEAETPFRTVAVLTIPRQRSDGEARLKVDEEVTFRPAHSLAAHRPLGSVMRARLKVYDALSKLRHERNGVPEREPHSPADLPQ